MRHKKAANANNVQNVLHVLSALSVRNVAIAKTALSAMKAPKAKSARKPVKKTVQRAALRVRRVDALKAAVAVVVAGVAAVTVVHALTARMPAPTLSHKPLHHPKKVNPPPQWQANPVSSAMATVNPARSVHAIVMAVTVDNVANAARVVMQANKVPRGNSRLKTPMATKRPWSCTWVKRLQRPHPLQSLPPW